MLYAILSDIHANYQALLAVETYVNRLQTNLGREIHYWFLGDIVGYGPEPVECLKWLWNHFSDDPHWVVGNHDQEVVWRATNYLEQGGITNTNATGVNEEANFSWNIHCRLVPEDERRWEWFKEKVLQAQTHEAHDLVHLPFDDLQCILVHGSIDSITRRTTYLYAWTSYLIQQDLRVARTIYGGTTKTLLVHGHSHYPHLASLGAEDKVIFHSIRYGEPHVLENGVFAINPGSVGQPRDGDPRAAFALLDIDAHTITYYRVMYNVLESIRKLEEGGYPSSLSNRLESGDGGTNLVKFRHTYNAPYLDRLTSTTEARDANGVE